MTQKREEVGGKYYLRLVFIANIVILLHIKTNAISKADGKYHSYAFVIVDKSKGQYTVCVMYTCLNTSDWQVYLFDHSVWSTISHLGLSCNCARNIHGENDRT